MPAIEPSERALSQPNQRPRCFIVAGPNGAGKTTASRALVTDRHGILRIINPDTIAAGIAGQSELGAVSAGKLALDAQAECLAGRLDFSIETTLSGRRWNRFLDALDDADYVTTVYYLWMPNPKLCVARVRSRVAMGGHGVPDADIRRRFVHGARNLLEIVLPRVAAWSVLDASRDVMETVASGGARVPLAVSDRRRWDALRQIAESRVVRESAIEYAPQQHATTTTEPTIDAGGLSAVDLANRALRRAKAIHRALGVPMAVWRDGKVHWIAPENLPELPVDERPELPATSRGSFRRDQHSR